MKYLLIFIVFISALMAATNIYFLITGDPFAQTESSAEVWKAITWLFVFGVSLKGATT